MAIADTSEAGGSPGVIPVDIDLPESWGYRLKRVVLGPPLTTESLPNERLGNAVALGVLAPDCISSSAYGSEEMLRILLPYVGLAAFSLLIPVTLAILGVLVLVTLSYREVVQVYTRAGGSYVVARDNFGPGVAQIAAVALLIDYTVTVAVQTAAGTDALVSAVPRLTPYILPITLASVVLICYGNLRGIREAGRTFAIPTYAFVLSLGAVVVVGLVEAALGRLHAHTLYHPGVIHIGIPGHGLLAGASMFIILKAFANGGSSLTGLEAISNGVSAFRAPEGRNARRVLVTMSVTLGFLVLGVSLLAHITHAVPYAAGAPTVVSQEAQDVFGTGLIGHVLYLVVQAATMLVLFTGANTSFNGFPFLASFVAEDSFLPRQLTHRGHRLTFSNGIIVLAIVSFLLLLATGANVDALVGVYAIGVFTGFTMAGAGMVRYHFTHKEPGWRHKAPINFAAAVLSLAVVVIFGVTKFTQGAWVVLLLFPVMITIFLRLNRRYRQEAAVLGEATPLLSRLVTFRRSVVLVMIDTLDLATVRALRYALTLQATEVRAIHMVLDSRAAEELAARWAALPGNEVTLERVDCPDRRLARTAVRIVAAEAMEEGTQVTVLLPRRTYSPLSGRLLHDRTADRIAAAVSKLRHVAATIVPFDPATPPQRVGRQVAEPELARRAGPAPLTPPIAAPAREVAAVVAEPPLPAMASTDVLPIAQVRWRERARVRGQVRSVETRPMSGAPVLEATLTDDSGGLRLLFYGRRAVPGIVPGARLDVSGMVTSHKGALAIANPSYELLAAPESDPE